jgi:hypothetical protein
MCCFSAKVKSVADTNIFARASAQGRQFLVYSMKYEADGELAMILPLPVPPGSPEDAVRFIDLSGYPKFFDDMKLGFPPPPASRAMPKSIGFAPQSVPLKVHQVGSFEASFVPAQRDFARLDRRFRLPDNVWGKLPQYRDWGFGVFKLKAGSRDVHPMAFEFPRRDPGAIFFPTVHIHHGKVESRARFDHFLFCQTPGAEPGWVTSARFDSSGPQPALAAAFMDVGKAQGLLDPDQPVHKLAIEGMRKNEDIILKGG